MVHRDIVVVGASAGGVEALSQLVSDFPEDFSAAVFVVLHVSPHSKSVLPDILARAGKLPVQHAVDGESILRGKIYVAPPDHHLLIQEDVIRVVRGPRENGHRPAVDPLFRTAARYFGPQVIGVVLTGALDDGTAGLQAIKSRGGVAVVQDPDDAFHSGMPSSAVRNVEVDHVLPLSLIGSALLELTEELVEEYLEPVSREMQMETDMARFSEPALQDDNRPGSLAGLPALSVMERFLNSTTAKSFVSVAVSATHFPPILCWRNKPMPWNRRSGSPCVHWKKAPPFPGASRSGRAPSIVTCQQGPLKNGRRRRNAVRASFARYCCTIKIWLSRLSRPAWTLRRPIRPIIEERLPCGQWVRRTHCPQGSNLR